MQRLARRAGNRCSGGVTAISLLAWELILAGRSSVHIAAALSLDRRTSTRLCAAVISAADILGFVQACYPGRPATIRAGVVMPPIPRFTGLLSFWDRDLTCLYANRTHMRLFGKPAGAVVGHSMLDLLSPVWVALCEPHIRKAACSGKSQQFEVVTAGSDGSMVVYLTYYTPSIDARGTVTGFFSYTVNIDENVMHRSGVMPKGIGPRPASCELRRASGALRKPLEVRAELNLKPG